MRKLLILSLLALMLVGALNAGTNLNVELWNRWTYHMIDGEDDAVVNDIALKRGYVGLSHQVNEQICGKFLVDFFNSDKTAYGAGMKARLAYLNFKNYFVDDLDFTFGLMKVYFGTIYDWSYPTIDLSPNDRYGTLASTDYGFGAHYLLPNGFGEIHAATYNGEGYANGAHDTDMAYLGNIRVNPVKGITLGASYYQKTYLESYTDDNDDYFETEYDFDAYTGFVKFKMLSWLDLTGQYLAQTRSDSSDVTSTVISVIPVINLGAFSGLDMEAVFRYDMFDDNTDIDDDAIGSEAYDFIVAGLNYYLARSEEEKPLLWLQANYSLTSYKWEDIDIDDFSEFLIQLRWKFSQEL